MKNTERNLKVLECSIVPVYEGKVVQGGCETEQLVNARELHAFIESKQQFSDWIKNRIEKYDFIENQDYIIIHNSMKNSEAGRPAIDYILRLDVAKEIAMVENNPKGKMVRRYFIEAEKDSAKKN
jgi:anti-repressor protein